MELHTVNIVGIFLLCFCAGTKSECSEGFWENGSCHKCSLYLNYCNKCQSANECLECKENFFLYSNNQCGKCQEHCKFCSTNMNNETICDSCKDGYYWDSTYCKKCPEQCSTCSSENSCTQCKYGFRLFNGHCFSCSIVCEECVDHNNCSRCYEPFYGLSAGCVNVCPVNCQYKKCNDFGECYTCLPGYFGPACMKNCSEECDNLGCNQTTGICNKVTNTTEQPDNQRNTPLPRDLVTSSRDDNNTESNNTTTPLDHTTEPRDSTTPLEKIPSIYTFTSRDFRTTLASDTTSSSRVIPDSNIMDVTYWLIIGLVTTVLIIIVMAIAFIYKSRRKNDGNLIEMRDRIEQPTQRTVQPTQTTVRPCPLVPDRNTVSGNSYEDPDYNTYDQIDDIARGPTIHSNRNREVPSINSDSHLYSYMYDDVATEHIQKLHNYTDNHYLSLQGDSAGSVNHEDKSTCGQTFYYSYPKFPGMISKRSNIDGEKADCPQVATPGNSEYSYAGLQSLQENGPVDYTTSDHFNDNPSSDGYITPISNRTLLDPNRTSPTADIINLGFIEDE